MSTVSLTLVRLLTDRDLPKGVPTGSIGVILHVCRGGFEVEFSRDDGTTIAWIYVGSDGVKPYREAPPWRPRRRAP